MLVGEPVAENVGRKPLPPFALRGHARPDRDDRQADTHDRQRHKHGDLVPERVAVAARERIEEIAVPIIQAVLHGELRDRDNDEADSQRPCDHGGLAAPKSPGARPEPGKPRAIRMIGVRHRPLLRRVRYGAAAPVPFFQSSHGDAARVERAIRVSHVE